MASWYLKCVVDSCKALVPFQNQIRDVKYRFIPYVGDAWNNELTIRQGLNQIADIRAVRSLEGATVLEVGSGWQPFIPTLFSLAGAKRVYLTDLRRLLQPASFQTAMAALNLHRRLIVDSLQISEKTFDETIAGNANDSLADAFGRRKLEYLAPCDCRKLSLPDQSVDIVISRAVLEHIPPQVIQDIFHESYRLLTPQGLACHYVDNSDHWQHADNSISRVNFLRFPDSVFRWTYLNGLNYQNRLRHPEYVAMLRKAGFDLLRQEGVVDSGALEALKTLPLDEQFRRFATEDLAALTSYLLARKP
jgi:SAM-dependent methyltransferase